VVEVVDETNRFPHAARLQRILERLLALKAGADREMTLVLLDDSSISELNERDRGVAGPTDVLSYPTWEPDDDGLPQVPHLGDVLISIDTAGRQAAEQGHTLFEELVTLAAHGLTHLLGYDHQTEEEWQIFRETQGLALQLARDGTTG